MGLCREWTRRQAALVRCFLQSSIHDQPLCVGSLPNLSGLSHKTDPTRCQTRSAKPSSHLPRRHGFHPCTTSRAASLRRPHEDPVQARPTAYGSGGPTPVCIRFMTAAQPGATGCSGEQRSHGPLGASLRHRYARLSTARLQWRTALALLDSRASLVRGETAGSQMTFEGRYAEYCVRRAITRIASPFDDLKEEAFTISRRVELEVFPGLVPIVEDV